MRNADKPANPVAYIEEFQTIGGYEKRDEVFFGLTKLEHFTLELSKAAVISGRNIPFVDIARESIRHATILLNELDKENG